MCCGKGEVLQVTSKRNSRKYSYKNNPVISYAIDLLHGHLQVMQLLTVFQFKML